MINNLVARAATKDWDAVDKLLNAIEHRVGKHEQKKGRTIMTSR